MCLGLGREFFSQLDNLGNVHDDAEGTQIISSTVSISHPLSSQVVIIG